MIAAILIAASLSSDSIGTFFTLPTWMPTEVTSHDTPGSDPTEGSGWYVDELEPDGYTEWTTTIGDETDTLVLDQYSPPQWSVVNIMPTPADFYMLQNWEVVKIGDDESTSLSWNMWVDGYLTEDDYWMGNATRKTYACTATRERSFRPTGRRVPRAARLTQEVQAGVYSTFEAYCERQYFALQGQSNVWDTAVYGPTTPKHFWYSPDARTITTVTTNFTPWEVVANVDENTYRYTWKIYWLSSMNKWDIGPLAGSICWDYKSTTMVGNCNPRYVAGSYDALNLSGSVSIKFTGNESFVATYSASRSKSITTNTTYYSGSEFVFEPCSHTPTNRTVRTRRLVEYDNVCGLADYMTDKWCNYGFAIIGARRPGWIEAIDNLSVYGFSGFRGWWSTTDDKIFGGTRIVPDFGWTSSPQSYDWSECSQAFTCLSDDDVWKNDMGDNRIVAQPLYNMMYNLDFSTPKRLGGLGASQVSETMRTMIETNFPHADGWAITNDTRRLFSDRLCCMNQVLGLMDRTYHEPEVIYPNVATNISFFNQWGCLGEKEVECVMSTDTATGETIYEIVPSTVSNFVWEAWHQTNWIERTNSQTDGKALYHRVSKAATDSGCGFSIEPSYTCGMTKEHMEGVLVSYFGSDTVLSGCFVSSTVSEGRIDYIYYIDCERGGSAPYGSYISISVALPEVYSNVTVRADYTYARSYNVKHPHVENPYVTYTFGPTQPGRDAYQTSRVKDARAGIVNGVHYRRTNYELSQMPWSSYGSSASSAAYSSAEFDYSSRADLIEKANSYLGGAYAYAISFWGNDPDDWDDVIPIDAADATRCREIAGSLGSACLRWEQRSDFLTQYFRAHTDANAVAKVDYVETYIGGTDPIVVESFVPTHSLVIRGVTTEPYENPAVVRDPFSIDIKAGTMTRTDWEWKTLK